MAERAADVVKSLMKMGMMVTMNQAIDADTAELVIEEFGHKRRPRDRCRRGTGHRHRQDRSEDLQPRPPIVTIMGHVDHGKTSLLDAIRKTSVVSGEAGGITQHIGAYQVKTDSGPVLTFLDTPGHAAFTSMRARGAQVTDIVVLVVAADDAVMPQTVEAINHAKAAKVPMIVAINKIDKPRRTRRRCGPTFCSTRWSSRPCRATCRMSRCRPTGKGLDGPAGIDRAAGRGSGTEGQPEPGRPGAVIEAKLDVGRGPVATVLVQNGTLRKGDIFVVGEKWGKVRALVNDKGETCRRGRAVGSGRGAGPERHARSRRRAERRGEPKPRRARSPNTARGRQGQARRRRCRDDAGTADGAAKADKSWRNCRCW
jgi:translation initiation factor IF-2